MKLYYSKGAASLAVRIMIHEMNLACTFESVDLKTKITETGGDFLNITPKGYVPALKVDDKIILTETAIILQYLADQHHATAFLSELGNVNRYRVLEWTNFISTELHKSCAVLLNPNIPEVTKDILFNTGLKMKLNMVNDHLSKNQYLVQDQFTIADGYLFTVLFWLPHFLKIELSPWHHLDGYFLKHKNRASIQTAFQEEIAEAI
ncbi:MAG: glutathione S-transferase N-terminal domain-containing protein [Gammaproteobacteria bacterium]|nr:glutathione S-transferase N-terminal domain-containing protein [Gammaproteobacteria bacterium]MCW5582677.1 glutathione S-transferase N-terminal domain-containing protein [Gammaproteobacteria bacterium]